MDGMQNNNMGMSDKKVCKCPHHSIVPWAIIVIGIVWLLGSFNIFSMMVVNVLVAVLLIVIGIMKLTSRKCKCC